mgnify:CR=1 FL=1
MAIRSLKIGEDDNVKGHPFAPVQLIEYGDYECPYSRKAYRFAQMLLRKREGHIYFLSVTFLFATNIPMHKWLRKQHSLPKNRVNFRPCMICCIKIGSS